MSFYDNFLQMCNDIGKTPSKVAEEAGISKSIVSRWKNGGGATDATVAKLAAYFDVPPGVLNGEYDKKVFAKNLAHYIDSFGPFFNKKELVEKVGVSLDVLDDWLEGKKYPRIGAVEKLADYFGILKSDLIEEWPEEQEEICQPVWMDSDTYDIVCMYKTLSPAQKKIIRETMQAFLLG